MNKKNFGRVIKRIERNISLWNQKDPPGLAFRISGAASAQECKTPYCFLGHAEFLRTDGKHITPRNQLASVDESRPLARWLGLEMGELELCFSAANRLSDFKRWHKAGKVS